MPLQSLPPQSLCVDPGRVRAAPAPQQSTIGIAAAMGACSRAKSRRSAWVSSPSAGSPVAFATSRTIFSTSPIVGSTSSSMSSMSRRQTSLPSMSTRKK